MRKGAGPTVLALAISNFETIGQTISKKWLELGGVETEWKVVKISVEGSRVILED